MSAVMPTYAPSNIAFESGNGVYLFSDNGKKYLDFGSGIAVTSVGHSHPKLVKAITDQASKVLHYSNLYKKLQIWPKFQSYALLHYFLV